MAKTKATGATNTSGYSDGSDIYTSTVTTSNNTTGSYTIINTDASTYANELAVLHSDMDEITKIKIIQALKKPETQYIYYNTPKYPSTPKYPLEPSITWTCDAATGDAPKSFAYGSSDGSSIPINTINYNTTVSKA